MYHVCRNYDIQQASQSTRHNKQSEKRSLATPLRAGLNREEWAQKNTWSQAVDDNAIATQKVEVIISTNDIALTQHGTLMIQTIAKSIIKNRMRNSSNYEKNGVWVVSVDKTENNGTKLIFGVCDEIDLRCAQYKEKFQINMKNTTSLKRNMTNDNCNYNHNYTNNITNSYPNNPYNSNDIKRNYKHIYNYNYTAGLPILIESKNTAACHVTPLDDDPISNKNVNQQPLQSHTEIESKLETRNDDSNSSSGSYSSDPNCNEKSRNLQLTKNVNGNTNATANANVNASATGNSIQVSARIHHESYCKYVKDKDMILLLKEMYHVMCTRFGNDKEKMENEILISSSYCICQKIITIDRVLQLLHESMININSSVKHSRVCESCVIGLSNVVFDNSDMRPKHNIRIHGRRKIVEHPTGLSDIVRVMRFSIKNLISHVPYRYDFNNHNDNGINQYLQSKSKRLQVIAHGFSLISTLLVLSKSDAYVYDWGRGDLRTKLINGNIGEAIRTILINSEKEFDSIQGKELIPHVVRVLHLMCESVPTRHRKKSTYSYNYEKKQLISILNDNDWITNKLFTVKKHGTETTNEQEKEKEKEKNMGMERIGLDVELFKSIVERIYARVPENRDDVIKYCDIFHFMSKATITGRSAASTVMVKNGLIDLIDNQIFKLKVLYSKFSHYTLPCGRFVMLAKEYTKLLINIGKCPDNVKYLLELEYKYRNIFLTRDISIHVGCQYKTRYFDVDKTLQLIELNLDLIEQISKGVHINIQIIKNKYKMKKINYNSNNYCTKKKDNHKYNEKLIEFERNVYKLAIEPIFNYYHELYTVHGNTFEQEPNGTINGFIRGYGTRIVSKACKVLCRMMNDSWYIVTSFEKDNYNPSIMNGILMAHLNKNVEIGELMNINTIAPTSYARNMYNAHEQFTLNKEFGKDLINVFKCVKQCEWKYMIRYIWIGFYKNNKKTNRRCYIYLLPKDIVKYVVKYLENGRIHDMIQMWSNMILCC